MKKYKKIAKIIALSIFITLHSSYAQTAAGGTKSGSEKQGSQKIKIVAEEDTKSHSKAGSERKKRSPSRTPSSSSDTDSDLSTTLTSLAQNHNVVVVLKSSQRNPTRARSGSDPVSPRNEAYPKNHQPVIVVLSSEEELHGFLNRAQAPVTEPVFKRRVPAESSPVFSTPQHQPSPSVRIKPLDLSKILAERERKEKGLHAHPLKPKRPVSATSTQNMFLHGLVGAIDNLVVKNSLIIFDETEEKTGFKNIQSRISKYDIVEAVKSIISHFESAPHRLPEMFDEEHVNALQKCIEKLKKYAAALEKKMNEGASYTSFERNLERQNKYAITLLELLMTNIVLETTVKSKVLEVRAQMIEKQKTQLFEDEKATA